VLALAYPDRLAIRKGGPGKFQLRTGNRAWVPATDDLANEQFLVAADLDGRRSDARIRLGASLHAGELAAAFEHEVEERRTVAWDRERDDLVERVTWRLGGIVLDEVTWRPDPGAETEAALFQRVALAITPQNLLAANELGVLLAQHGQLQDAERIFQQCVATDATPQTWRNLADSSSRRTTQRSRKEETKIDART
jgi:hypothetical protein